MTFVLILFCHACLNFFATKSNSGKNSMWITLRGWMATVLTVVSCGVLAQVPYVFTYNPGPSRGTKWVVKASDGITESAASVLSEAPRPVWARVCYTIGPSDSTVTLYAQTGNKEPKGTEVAWGGCADIFGTSIWIGNPHGQPVGGYYGIAPATPAP
jgi:hypothetical protein